MTKYRDWRSFQESNRGCGWRHKREKLLCTFVKIVFIFSILKNYLLNLNCMINTYILILFHLFCILFYETSASRNINDWTLEGRQHDLYCIHFLTLMVGRADCFHTFSKQLFLHEKRGLEIPSFVTFPNSLWTFRKSKMFGGGFTVIWVVMGTIIPAPH